MAKRLDGTKNLTPFKPGEKRAVEAGAKGGRAGKNNINKIIAGRLAWMKRENKWTDNQLDWFKARLENPKASVMNIEQALIKRKDDIPPDKYLAMMTSIHKMKFGEKVNVQTMNFNVDVQLDETEATELLEKFNGM